jgi:uncharacterized protein
MPQESSPPAGTIVWKDLTVPDAEAVRKFYCEVVGWRSEEFDGDFNMIAPGGKEPVAGVCYARGPNANLPPQWLLYIAVPDLDRCVRASTERGGRVVDGPRLAGMGRICVIQDPAGAFVALYEVPG